MNKKLKTLLLSSMAFLSIGAITSCKKIDEGNVDVHITVSYIITFNSNGGSSVESLKVVSGTKATKPADPTKEGYTFKGWYKDSALTEAFDFENGINENITLYAKWEEVSNSVTTYTVTFNSNGGSSVTAQTVNSGEKATKPTDPTKEGFTFVGWYKNEGLTESYDFNTSVTSALTLYAKWEAVVTPPTTYTVTFDSNGGSSVTAQTVNSGEKVTKPTDPTKSGFEFKGWYKNEGLIESYDFNAAVTSALTLYAKWEAVVTPPTTYIVTFDSNGGSSVTAQTVNSGEKVTKPTDPTKSGFEFKGWFKNEGLTENYDFNTAVTSALTLYAKWEAVVTPPTTYTVTFDSNGGTSVTAQTVNSGAQITEPSDPTKNGYTFDCWCTDEALQNEFDVNSQITASITLYARWIQEVSSTAISITSATAGNETAVVEFAYNADLNDKDFSVYYSTDKTNYTKVDSQLVSYANNKGKAYLIGLKADNYYVKIVAEGTTETKISSVIQVSEQDRSGYAHYNYNEGVGAYNDDGTLKTGAKIIYVSDATKNTVKYGSYEGIVEILTNLKNIGGPVVVRFLDMVKTTQWDSKTYSSYSASTIQADYKNAKNSSGKYYINDLLSAGANTINTDLAAGITTLNGLEKYSYGTTSDSYWNMCDISNAQNITIEGIGTEAGLYQWGLTWKNCKSIEVRNLTFDKYTEDACSFEGSTDSATLSNYNNVGRYWIHNNTFTQGLNRWDVSDDQDKHEGDGATDFKRTGNITIAYNHYIENHKTGLIGSDDNVYQANVTFHHNYYERCNSRMPLGRNANMHMYNNYYYGSTGTNMSIRARGYAFVENCVLENCKNPFETVTGKESKGMGSYTGAVKSYNNTLTGCSGKNNSTVVTSRTATVTNNNSYGQTFDTDSTIFYYDSATQKSKVDILNETSDVKTFVLAHAGAGTTYYNSLELNLVEYNPSQSQQKEELTLSLYNLTQGSSTTAGNGTYVTKYVKTIYKSGEAFDSSNIKAYANGELVDNSKLTFEGYSNTAGNYDITVTYTKDDVLYTGTYKVYVLANTLDNLNVAVSSSYSVGGTETIGTTEYVTFKTIEQALEYYRFIKTPTISNRGNLLIKAGYYNEKLEIDVPYLTIKGEGMAKATYESDENYKLSEYNAATIIEWNSLFGVKENGLVNVTDSTQTVAVRESAVACEIENLTISNWWNNEERFNSQYDYLKDISYTDSNGNTKYLASNNKVSEHRALAILIQADQFVMKNSSLLGYQDTLELMTGRQYFNNCYITGATDYIFGTNNVSLFDGCTIHTIYNGNATAGGYITAFKGYNKTTSEAIQYGVIFYDCVIDGDTNSANVSLGRPWGESSSVAFIECEMSACISKVEYTSGTTSGQRYVKMGDVEPTTTGVYFIEYGNTGDGAISAQQNGMYLLPDKTSADMFHDYATIFGRNNGNVNFALAWDPINGLEQDNNTYYYFNGSSSSTGTSYTYSGKTEGNTATLGGLTIDATTGKLEARTSNPDSQMNAGTKIRLTVAANTLITVDFYSDNYKINGLAATAGTMSMYFASQTEVEIVATDTNYLHSIIVSPNATAPTTVSSLVISGETTSINKDETLPTTNLVVYAKDNKNTYYQVTEYTVSISDGVDTFTLTDAVTKAGTYTVTISFGGAEKTYELEVVAPETVNYSYVFDFNATDTEEADTATVKNYQVPSDLNIQSKKGTIGDDFIIEVDATTGKLAARSGSNTDTQFNAGTILSFTAPYNCVVTVVQRSGNVTINGITNGAKTVAQQFNKDDEVSIVSGGSYLTSITIEYRESVNSFEVASLSATVSTTSYEVGNTYDSSVLTVKGFDSSNAYYKTLLSTEYSISIKDPDSNGFDYSNQFTKSGTYTVTITYSATVSTTYTFDVIARTNYIENAVLLDFATSDNYTAALANTKVDYTNATISDNGGSANFQDGYITFDVHAGTLITIYPHSTSYSNYKIGTESDVEADLTAHNDVYSYTATSDCKIKIYGYSGNYIKEIFVNTLISTDTNYSFVGASGATNILESTDKYEGKIVLISNLLIDASKGKLAYNNNSWAQFNNETLIKFNVASGATVTFTMYTTDYSINGEVATNSTKTVTTTGVTTFALLATNNTYIRSIVITFNS